VRNGSVVDLQIAPREITAIVSGSEIYRVKVDIADVARARWKTLCADCSGGIDSLVELLQGRFSRGVMERLCRQDTGLFPHPSEIRFTCSCSDYASMCKHIAAVLYGVGARLDESPELLFRLRAVDETELLSNLGSARPDTRPKRDTPQTLVGNDLAALFGLDMEESGVPAPSLGTGAISAGPRKKTRKTVIANTATASAAEAKTKAAKSAREKKAGSDKKGRRPTAKTPSKAMSAHAAQKNTMAPTRPASKKTVASPTKSVARPATAKPSTEMRKVQVKTTVSAHRRSDPNPVIATPGPVSQSPSRRPVRSDVPKPAGRKARPTS
jgi:uncharacterized Zn finger protein